MKEKFWKSSDVKLLSVTTDKKPNFYIHVDSIYLKVKRKSRALGRLAKLLSCDKETTTC